MPFPSSAGSKPETLAQALALITTTAGVVKQQAQQIKAASLAGPTSASNVITYAGDLADNRDLISRLAATPGLSAYAQAQYNDGTLDITAAFNAMMTAVDATRSWVNTNFPKDGAGNLLEKKFDAQVRVQLNTFTTAQLAGFRTQLDALIATID